MKALPKGPFGTVIADPPWAFQNQGTRAATDNHYENLSLQALCAMKVPAADQSHLYLWTTGGHLVDGSAAQVAKAWGFEPKYLLTWVKTGDLRTSLERSGRVVHHVVNKEVLSAAPKISQGQFKISFGLGNWFRRNAEMVLFCVKGKAPAMVKNLPDTFFAPRADHSQKPDLLHEMAELMSPGPRLELFARRGRKGWKTWGDQVQP